MPKKPKAKLRARIMSPRLPKTERINIRGQMVPAAPLAPPRTLLEVIANAARDPAVDTAKMKALLDMKYEEERREAENAYIVAMEACQTELPAVLKDTENPQTRSLYAKLETLSRIVDPIIHHHGFALSFGMGDSTLEKHYRITCEVSHKAGHTRNFFYDLPADEAGFKGTPNKTPLHGVASTTTYARRYLKTLIFDIRVAGLDDDGNQSTALPISEKQLAVLKEKIKEVEADEQKICEFAKVAELKDVPVNKLGTVLVLLDQKAKLKKAGAAA